MQEITIEEALTEANEAAAQAANVRKLHRRRTPRDSPNRQFDLEQAMERIRQAMKPIRTFRGKAPYMTQTERNLATLDRVQEASQRLQSERRKTWKMLQTEASDVLSDHGGTPEGEAPEL